MDITTVWDTHDGEGDYALSQGALLSGNDIATAMLISLFSDQAASNDDALPDAPQVGLADRRGWWGDTGQQYPIGSKLWLLDRSKGPLNVTQTAIQTAKDALQWMIDDLVIASFDIQAWWKKPDTLLLVIAAFDTDGRALATISEPLW